MIVINFKTYPEFSGEKALIAAQLCQKVNKRTKVKIIIGLQATDIYRVASKIKIPVFAQHFDPVMPGRFTGWITALALKKAGADGVFLNHSEHPYPSDFKDLREAILLAKNYKLKTLVFANNLANAKRIDVFSPDYIALEEPSLVAKSAMVKQKKYLNLIKKFSGQIKSIPLLGAGIRTKEDVRKSLELGVKGIVFASEFAKSKNRYKLLLDFTSCF